MKRITINVSDEVFKKIEVLRGTKPHFRSGFINSILEERFGIPGRRVETK